MKPGTADDGRHTPFKPKGDLARPRNRKAKVARMPITCAGYFGDAREGAKRWRWFMGYRALRVTVREED